MTQFVNRKKEFETFDTYLENIRGRNLIIIYGKMGVGKSEFTKQFLLSYQKYPAIKVNMSQKLEAQPGDFLNRIKNCSNKPINSINFNFSEKKFFSKKNNLILFTKFIFNVATVIPILGDILRAFSDTYNEYEKMKLSLQSLSDKNNYIQFEDYLKQLYNDIPFVLNIENIQSIDTASWNSLFNILSNIQDFNLILEYTTNSDKNIEIIDIIEKFRNIITDENIKIIELKQLDKSCISEMAQNISYEERKNLEKQLENWDGNLKELKTYLYLNRYKKDITISDSIKETIASIDQEEKKWLMRIYLSSDDFTLKALLGLDLPMSIYETLKNMFLVKIVNEFVVIDHDTICKILDLSQYEAERHNAIIFWKNFYENKYKNTPEINTLIKILHFTILENDLDSLNSLLNTIHKKMILASDLTAYLQRIEKMYYKKTLKNHCADSEEILLFWLVELYQNIGDYKKAYTFLEFIANKKCSKYIALKALLLYQIGLQESAVDFCTNNINENDEHLELFLRIVRLEANYVLGDIIAAKNEFEYIEENSSKFEDYLEYGFFLRNAELIKKKPSEMLPYLNKSIQHFEKFGANKQTVSSRINLGVCNALMGNLKNADKQFKKAYSKRENFLGLSDMILNNQAVILQYRGKLENVKEKLMQAQKYAYYDFNKLAIKINLLVYNIRTGIEDMSLVEDILLLIENRTFKNKRIIYYAYFNLYKYFENINPKLSSYYYNKLIEFDLPYYFNVWLSNTVLTPKDPEYYRTRIKWPINFLNEWSIEFDSSLMRF